MASPPTLIVQWRCGECGDLCDTMEEAAVHCDESFWEATEAARKVLKELEGVTEVIHGGCRGADRLAGEVAMDLGMAVRTYPAKWALGKQAGPLRNQEMLARERPNIVLAFCDDLNNSKGTADMVRRAKVAGVQTWVVSSTGATVEVS